MKAKIQLPVCYKKEAEAYIAKLEAESIARVHEEVMKEAGYCTAITVFMPAGLLSGWTEAVNAG